MTYSMNMNLKKFFLSHRSFFVSFGFWAAILAGLLLIYWPCIRSLYAYHDSLIYFLDTDVRFDPPGTIFAFITGRYLAAFFQVLIGNFVHSLQDLQVVRLFSIVQLSVCGLLMVNWLRRNLLSSAEAFFAVLILLTLPPFQVVVCQAGMSFYPLSVLAAIGSFLTCFRALRHPINKRRRIFLFCSSLLLFIVALTIYPSGAMFFWAMMAIFILFSPAHLFIKAFFKKIASMLAVGILAIVLYRLLLESTKPLYALFGDSGYCPYSTTTHVLGKLSWFFSGPVLKILNFWNIHFSLAGAVYALSFVAGGIILSFVQRADRANRRFTVLDIGTRVLTVGALFFFTSIPNLVYADPIAFYRCYMALAAFMVFVFLWALRRYAKVFSTIQSIVLVTALCFLTCAGGFWARQTVDRYRVKISTQEFNFLRQALQSVDLGNYSRIYVVQPDQAKLFVSDDEFGNLTTSYGNDIVGFVSAGLAGIIKKDFKIYHIDYDPATHKTIYLLRKDKERKPSFSYRVVLDFGPEAKEAEDLSHSTLVLDMNRVVDSLLTPRAH